MKQNKSEVFRRKGVKKYLGGKNLQITLLKSIPTTA